MLAAIAVSHVFVGRNQTGFALVTLREHFLLLKTPCYVLSATARAQERQARAVSNNHVSGEKGMMTNNQSHSLVNLYVDYDVC